VLFRGAHGLELLKTVRAGTKRSGGLLIVVTIKLTLEANYWNDSLKARTSSR
jgi:hypothetical protein